MNQYEQKHEALATLEHQIWSDWVRHMFDVSTLNPDGTVTIPQKYVQQWQHEINTAYADLTEDEKDGDREQINKILSLLVKDL